MIAVRIGDKDFILLPEHKAQQAKLKETGLVVMYNGIMYLLHDTENVSFINTGGDNIEKHSIPNHVLTPLDCYI